MEVLRIGRELINHRYFESVMFFRALELPVCTWSILIQPMHEYILEAHVHGHVTNLQKWKNRNSLKSYYQVL